MTKDKTFQEQSELLKDIIEIKDSIIKDREFQIERLEEELRIAYATISKINKALNDFNKTI